MHQNVKFYLCFCCFYSKILIHQYQILMFLCAVKKPTIQSFIKHIKLRYHEGVVGTVLYF